MTFNTRNFRIDGRQEAKNYTGWQSDVIVDLIKRYDFPYITLNPGASFRGLHDSLVNYGDNEPPMMLCNHEEIAVQIAHGYAKATGKPMVVILHNLVGLLHACMAIYYAYHRPRADLHHGRHRPDGRGQAPPAHRLDPHRAGAGQRGARLHQVGLPADLDRRRAGKLRARLFDHDDRAAGPDLHVLRRGAAGSAEDARRAAAAGRAPSRRPRRWRPIRARIEAIADKLLKAEHPMLLPEYAGRRAGGFESIVELAETDRRRGVGRQQRAQLPEQASAVPEHGQAVAQAHRSDRRPRREGLGEAAHRAQQRQARSAKSLPPRALRLSSRSASPRSASANGRWTTAACSPARCARSATRRSASRS